MLGFGGFLALLAAPAIDAGAAYDQPRPEATTISFRASPWVSKTGGGFALGGTF